MQDGIRLDEELSRRKLFQICVAPMLTVPFGWADPDLDGFINVAGKRSKVRAKSTALSTVPYAHFSNFSEPILFVFCSRYMHRQR